jgi:aromatic ring-cleaving dioxygenase
VTARSLISASKVLRRLRSTARISSLDVLVHPLTDDMVDDHSIYALWLGTPVALKLDSMQRRGYRDALLPTPLAQPA